MNGNDDKPNPVCKNCTSWMDTQIINGIEWLKCRTCGIMFKANRKPVTPI